MEKPKATPGEAQRSKLKQELLYVIAQHLEDDKMSTVAEHLMRKARLHLNLGYVTKLVLRGKWEKVEKHLGGFFPLAFTEQDHATNELLSLIKRQRFLYLLYIGNTQACLEMLRKDLASVKGRDVYNKLNEALLHSQPLTLEIFKDYSLDESYRRRVAEQLKISITRHPHLLPFTTKPHIEAGTLRKLINQSLNWQHDTYCKPRLPRGSQQRAVLTSLLVDHKCENLLDMSHPTSPPSTASPMAAAPPDPGSAPTNTPAPAPAPAPAPTRATSPTMPPQAVPVPAPAPAPAPTRSTSPAMPPQAVPAPAPAPTRSTSPTMPPQAAAPVVPPASIQQDAKETAEPPLKVPRREGPGSAASSSASVSSAASSTSASASPVETSAAPTRPTSLSPEMLRKHLLHEWARIDTKTDAKVTAAVFRPLVAVPDQPDAQGERSILMGFSSGRIDLWAFNRGVKPKQVFTIQDPHRSAEDSVVALAWENASTFAIGYQKGDIAVYRYGDGTPTKEQVLTGHTDIVLRVLFWPSRPNTMISCSKDGSVIMWDTQLGKATRTYKDDGPVYGIWMSDQEGMPFILATGKAGLKCFIKKTKVPFETLPNGKYCTDVRIVSGRPFSVGPLIDSIVEWHSDKPEYKKPLRFKGYQGPDRDGPMPRIETIMDSYIAVPSKAGIHLWDINDPSPAPSAMLVPGHELITGGIGGITYDNGLLGVYSRSRGLVAIFGPAAPPGASNKRRRPSPEASTPLASDSAAPASTSSSAQPPATATIPPVAPPAPVVHTPTQVSLLGDMGSGVQRMRFVKKGMELLSITQDNFLRLWQLLPQGVKQTYANQYRQELTPAESRQLTVTSNESFALALIGTQFTVTDIRSHVGERLVVDLGQGSTALAGFPDDNNVIGVGSSNGVITIHSVKDMSHPTHTLATGHQAPITSIVLASKQLLVATDAQGRIYLAPWESTQAIPASITLPGFGSSPVHALLNRAQDLMIFYSDVEVGVYHLPSRAWRASFRLPPGGTVVEAAYSSSNAVLACALTNSTLLCLHSETLAVIGTHTLPERPLSIAAQQTADPASLAFAMGTESGRIYRVVL